MLVLASLATWRTLRTSGFVDDVMFARLKTTQAGSVELRFSASLQTDQPKPLAALMLMLMSMGVQGDTSRTSPLQGHLTVTVCHTAGHYGEEYDD